MVYASVAVAHECIGINEFVSPPWLPTPAYSKTCSAILAGLEGEITFGSLPLSSVRQLCSCKRLPCVSRSSPGCRSWTSSGQAVVPGLPVPRFRLRRVRLLPEYVRGSWA